MSIESDVVISLRFARDVKCILSTFIGGMLLLFAAFFMTMLVLSAKPVGRAATCDDLLQFLLSSR
jgi:hypothetical protein